MIIRKLIFSGNREFVHASINGISISFCGLQAVLYGTDNLIYVDDKIIITCEKCIKQMAKLSDELRYQEFLHNNSE